MRVFDYKFTRLDNYVAQVQKLQHFMGGHTDVRVEMNAGEHAITCVVEWTHPSQKSALEWLGPKSTELDDILFLLSIFTGRDVFCTDFHGTQMDMTPMSPDHRKYFGGGILRSSIPYKKDVDGKHSDPSGFPCDVGFEESVNKIYTLIRSKEWQDRFKGGYFLLLAQQAFRYQPLETAFTQAWIIWEHLFSILNQHWIPEKRMQQIEASEKISYILTAFGLRGEINGKSRERITALVQVRNRLIHFGRFPARSDVHSDAVLFMDLTDFIVAKILGLIPSGVFNTMEKLEKFLAETEKSNKPR